MALIDSVHKPLFLIQILCYQTFLLTEHIKYSQLPVTISHPIICTVRQISFIFQISVQLQYKQPLRISNFYNKIFVYLLFELFYKVKVSIGVKIHHKVPIDLIIIKRLETPYLVKKTSKRVNKQKFRCTNSRFVLVVSMS